MSDGDRILVLVAMLMFTLFVTQYHFFSETEDEVIAKMVKHGANPLEAACAINGYACYLIQERNKCK